MNQPVGFSIFQDAGPLEADSPSYVERAAESEARGHLTRMDYIMIVAPRQQGKTTLVFRLRGQLQPLGYCIPYIDLSTLDDGSEAAWYASLGEQILDQIEFHNLLNPLSLPSNHSTWRVLLHSLAQAACEANRNLVIALDEVGAIPKTWATNFFSVIRSVYITRNIKPCYRRLSFIVAGAYNPRDLIDNPDISDFNVSYRIPLDDYTFDHVKEFVKLLKPNLQDKDEPVINEIARRIHDWTGGQPFITQRMCIYLEQLPWPPSKELIDQCADRFFSYDDGHLRQILAPFKNALKRDYLLQVLPKPTQFTPSINDEHFWLAYVNGLIAPDKNGICQIRNAIYQRAWQAFMQSIQQENNLEPSPINEPRPSTGAVITIQGARGVVVGDNATVNVDTNTKRKKAIPDNH